MTTRYVYARAQLAGLLLRAARPLFRWRSRIVGRTFGGEPRWYDARVRAACERLFSALEMWQMWPYIEAMQQELAELDALGREVEELVAKAKGGAG